MVRILVEPKNALTKQYTHLLALDNVELVFDESSLEAAAEMAMARGTGARGLRSIIESTLLDVMFETPGSAEIRKVVVTDRVVRGEVRPLIYGEGDKRFEWQSDGKLTPAA
jgi:ATP-dependent Clp protease ATP-binding subunit ClpX